VKISRVMARVAVVVVMSVALAACGGSGPSATVKSLNNAMNNAKYSEMEQYLSKGIVEMSKQAGGGAMKEMADGMTHNGTQTKFEVLSEEIRGEGATVKIRSTFKDGGVEDAEISLVKEDGKWKMTF